MFLLSLAVLLLRNRLDLDDRLLSLRQLLNVVLNEVHRLVVSTKWASILRCQNTWSHLFGCNDVDRVGLTIDFLAQLLLFVSLVW